MSDMLSFSINYCIGRCFANLWMFVELLIRSCEPNSHTKLFTALMSFTLWNAKSKYNTTSKDILAKQKSILYLQRSY